jgi:hypothetical protein
LALGKLILIGGVALIAWWVIGRPTSIEELRADIDNITAQFKGQDASADTAPTAADPNSIDNTNTQDNTGGDDGSGGGQDQGGDQGQQDDGSGGGGGQGFGGGGRHRSGFGGGGQGGFGGGDQGQQDDGSGGDQGGDDGSDFAPSIGGGGSQSGDTTSIPTQSSTPFSDGGSAHDSGDDGSDFGGDFGGGGDQQDDGSTTPDQEAIAAPPSPHHHHQHLTKAQRDAQAAIAAKGKKPPHPQAVQAKGKHEYSGHGKYKGTPGFYTVHGHHHCFEGDAGCKCTDCHKCNCHGPVGNGTHHTPPHAVLKTQAPITQKQHAKQHNHPNLIAHKNSQHVKVSQTSHGGNNFLSTKTVNGKTVVTTNNPKHTKIVSNHPVHVVTQQQHHHPVVHHKKKKKKVVHHSNLAYTLGYDGGFHYLESNPISLLYNNDY